MFGLPPLDSSASAHDLDYLLRRAEQESIAQIRSPNAVVAATHGALAHAYSERARAMLGGTDSH